MDREDIVSEVAKVWDRRAMENELTHASIKIMAQHVEIESLNARIRDLERRLSHADWLVDKYRQDDRTTK